MTRPCTHKSRLVSSGWSRSELIRLADIRQRIEHVRFVPIADIDTKPNHCFVAPPGAESFCDEFQGLFPNLFPSVAGFCGQAHRTLSHLREGEFDVELVDFDLV